MTPWEELRQTGRLGEVGARLLYEVATATSRFFPPPSRGPRWTESDIHDLAHAVMTATDVPFGEELLAHAVDDATLRIHLTRLVRRRLAGIGRQTTKGARVRRLRELLKRDPRVERAGRDHYTLVEKPASMTELFHPDQLRAAARSVPITRPNWGPDTKRARPEASDASTLAVCVAVLGACPHPLPIGDLADILGERFSVPGDEPAPSRGTEGSPAELFVPDDADAVVARVAAERVWDELDEDERRTLPVLDQNARDAATILGVGRTKANLLQRATLVAIARALGVDHVPDDRDALHRLLRSPDHQPIVAALVRLALSSDASPP